MHGRKQKLAESGPVEHFVDLYEEDGRAGRAGNGGELGVLREEDA